MTAMRPERPGADKLAAEKTGPEAYAPNRIKQPEKLGEIDQAAANAFEGEIREFVRRDVTQLRRQRDADAAPDPVTENLNALIRRVASASVEEIDRVIAELHSVRDMLRNEGDRVSREIAGYASLSHAAMTAMKVIGDSVAQWKTAPDRTGQTTNQRTSS